MSRALKPGNGTGRDGGLTQDELEDVLAQLTVLEGKLTALSDRLALTRERAGEHQDGPVAGVLGAGWPEVTAAVPRAEMTRSRP